MNGLSFKWGPSDCLPDQNPISKIDSWFHYFFPSWYVNYWSSQTVPSSDMWWCRRCSNCSYGRHQRPDSEMQVAIRIRPENLEPTLLATQLLIIIVISTLWGIIPGRPHSRFQFQCYYAHFQSIYLFHLRPSLFPFKPKESFPILCSKVVEEGRHGRIKGPFINDVS